MKYKPLANKIILSMLVAAIMGGGLLFAAAQSLGSLTLTSVSPRIMTPNGDALNDVIFFKFDTTLAGVPLDSAVYDINGAKVGNLTLDMNDAYLTWDGKDENGQTVPAGIYIYSIKIGKNRATGTVVVAR